MATRCENGHGYNAEIHKDGCSQCARGVPPVKGFAPHTLARTTDPNTSKEAANRSEGLVGIHEDKILEALKQGEGHAEDIAARSALTDVEVSRRMKKLFEQGLVSKSGTKPKRSGRAATVWRKV